MTESPKNPGSEVEDAQPHMNPGESVEDAQPHMNPGEQVEGAEPHLGGNPGDAQGLKEVDPGPVKNPVEQGGMDDWEKQSGPLPHMNPGGLQTELGMPGMDDAGLMKHAADHLDMGGPEGQRGIVINWRAPLIGLLGLLLVLFGFLLFGPPAIVLGVFDGIVSQDSFDKLACPSDAKLKTAPFAETGDILPVSYALAGDKTEVHLTDQQGVPSFFDVFFFNVFNTANALRIGMGGEGFFPPSPCLGLSPDSSTPEPGTGVCSSTCRADTDCKSGFVCLPAGQCWQQACDAGNPAATEPVSVCGQGWLPEQGCTCCRTTLVCADGTVAQFNPTCGVGGGSTCKCGDNVCDGSCGEDINTCALDCHK